VTRTGRAFHRHAQTVLDHELRRARGRLTALSREQRLTVEEVSARVAAALVDGVLERARVEPTLAGALASIYDAEPSREPDAMPCTSD
jgi:hypothetical protein